MRAKMEQKSLEMIKPMFDAGVPLLTGSDCGPFNSYVYPGGSLHQELERLVAAGLSPQEALKTSVVNGPAFFDLQDLYGSIAQGKMADLIILSENPLKDIAKLRNISHVLTKGKLFEKEEIEEMMQRLKE